MEEMHLSSNLKFLRKKSELSQENLAEIIKASRQSISSWERGDSLPDVITLNTLAQFYKVSIDELMKKDLSKKKMDGFESNNNTTVLNIPNMFAIISSIIMLIVFAFSIDMIYQDNVNFNVLQFLILAVIPSSLISVMLIKFIKNKNKTNILLACLSILILFLNSYFVFINPIISITFLILPMIVCFRAIDYNLFHYKNIVLNVVSFLFFALYIIIILLLIDHVGIAFSASVPIMIGMSIYMGLALSLAVKENAGIKQLNLIALALLIINVIFTILTQAIVFSTEIVCILMTVIGFTSMIAIIINLSKIKNEGENNEN